MKLHECITPKLREWIEQQHVFFVATAPLRSEGHVNLSPKGHDCLRVIDDHTVLYIDMTGSGNETSAHIAENGRITMMWCGFEGPPRILRLYGRGEVVLPKDEQRWKEVAACFDDNALLPGTRQIIVNHVDRVQTSCGYAVPYLDYKEDRDALKKWSTVKGDDGLEKYRREQNVRSIDNLKTPLADCFEATSKQR
jgi:hypothetical protein